MRVNIRYGFFVLPCSVSTPGITSYTVLTTWKSSSLGVLQREITLAGVARIGLAQHGVAVAAWP